MSGLAALAETLPKCAAACLLAAVEGSTCAPTNATCVCQNEDLNSQATACITANCTTREGLFTKNLTSTSCGAGPAVDHSYVSVLIVFVVLSAIAIILRIIARFQAGVPVWWDDFIISLSFLGCVAFSTIVLIMESHGLGMDIWAVQFDDITLILKALYTLFVLYITSRDLVRLSILLFYQRIFGEDPQARRLIQFTFGLIIACCAAFDFAIIFGCTPLDYFWTSWDGQHQGHCISTNGIFWAGAFVVIAIDIWVMLIPLPFIVRLNFSRRKKILSGLMFAFGIFVVIVSLYRLKTINRFTLSQNPTLDFVQVGIWSALELYVGIICACLPNFHVLLKPVYSSLGFGSSSSKARSSYHGGGSGDNSGCHRCQPDTESGLESVNRATKSTTVDSGKHWSESQVHLNEPRKSDNPGTIEHIELDTRENSTADGE